MKKIQFRGASFRHIDMRINEGAAMVRCHMQADITPGLADKMKWEIYQDGHLISGLEGSTKLTGDLYLNGFVFKVQSAGNVDALEGTGTTADDFQLSRRKAESGDGIETTLRFVISSVGWKNIVEFFGNLGQARGALVLELKPETERMEQQELADAQGETEDEEEAEPEPKKRTPKGTLNKVN